MAWFVSLLVALVVNIVAYLIQPKAQTQKPAAATDLESPTAEAGISMPVVFGSMTVKGLNYLWWGEKTKREFEVDA